MTGWLLLGDAGEGLPRAPVTEHGAAAGWLSVWTGHRGGRRDAVRVDPRLLQPGAGACRISLVLLPVGQRPIADDPAVVQCRRDVLADARLAAVSLLVADPVHLAGAVSVARLDHPAELQALADDPFRRLGRARLLDVGPGLLGPVPLTVGPVLERYAGKPWPADSWA